jgi:Domain of unknown function (DUF5668)
MSRANRGGLFWGALLTLLGLIFLLNNFNLMPAHLIEWWPILVLLGGVWLFSQGLAQRRGGELIGGTVLLATGGFWLLVNFGWMDQRLFGPVLLIALGLGILVRSLLQRR